MGMGKGARDSVAVKVRQRFKALLADWQFSEILTGSAYARGARAVAIGVGMVSSIIVVRYYGVAMMGTLAVVTSFLVLATPNTSQGIPQPQHPSSSAKCRRW